jgi:hypothetical protein
MKQFTLPRDSQNEQRTFGTMLRENKTRVFETLEPPNPMPAGSYIWELRYSPSHKFAVFGALNVPGHDNIEIHPGNSAKDTKDCILPGLVRGTLDVDGETVDAVLHSKSAFDAFMAEMGVASYASLTNDDMVAGFRLAHPDSGRFLLTITNAPPVVIAAESAS